MSVQSHIYREVPPRPELLLNGDMRRHRRMPLQLAGRFMRADKSEHICRMRDISVGSASVTSEVSASMGERVVVYFEHLGGFDGTVARIFPGGFAFQFHVSEHKREKLAAQIMWLVNREDFPDDFGRKHERVATAGRKTLLKFAEGVTVDVELIDVSASGASIGTPARPPIGSEITLGKIPAIVRRHHERGIGVQFFDVLSEDALRAAFA